MPGPMLNKLGTGDGVASPPVKLNVRFASAVPVLVVNDGLFTLPPNAELLADPDELPPKVGVGLAPKAGFAFIPPNVGAKFEAPNAGVAFVLPKAGVAVVPKLGVVFEAPKAGVAFVLPNVVLPKAGGLPNAELLLVPNDVPVVEGAVLPPPNENTLGASLVVLLLNMFGVLVELLMPNPPGDFAESVAFAPPKVIGALLLGAPNATGFGWLLPPKLNGLLAFEPAELAADEDDVSVFCDDAPKLNAFPPAVAEFCPNTLFALG